MRTPQLVVFDLDGTLVDSRRDLADSANDMLAEYGAAPLPEEAIGHMVGSGAPQLVARALSAAQVDAVLDQALARFLSSYDRRLTNHTRPYPGIPELLESLHSRGVHLALLTNKPLQQSVRILDAFAFLKYFALRVGGDGPFPRKPAPDGLLNLVGTAMVTVEETLMVGDSAVDLQTAQHAGVRMCFAAYGFGFADVPKDSLSGAEAIARHPADIAELIFNTAQPAVDAGHRL